MALLETDMTEQPQEYVAIHEAGHAVVGLLLGKPLDVVTIEPDVDAGNAGHAITDHGDPYADLGGEDWNLMVRAISAYAGHMATIRLGCNEDCVEAGAENDYMEAAFACDSIAGPDEDYCAELQKSASETARMMVDMCWSQIRLLASALEEQRTIAGADVLDLLRI